MNLGDLFWQLRADGARLVTDSQKAGDEAGAKGGAAFEASFGKSAKKLAGGIAGALGGFALGSVLTGANQLDAAMHQLQADTGMTAEEAKSAEHAIAGMYQNNLQGFDQIGAAMAKVHNDLGLTGAAADKATALFLKFSTATGQDAAASVASFDDILDAWNLTADDAAGLMDKLIAGQHKFGGSITETQDALKAMAPAMQAANMSVDDGIALLNLFQTAGIDAAKAPAALAKAVKQLKPGQDLNDLIRQLAAIEDPTKRAQRAMEIFGAKSGIGFAQAIKPGIEGLQAFTTTAEENAGATDKAAAAIEDSFGNRLKLVLKNAQGQLAEFGASFGDVTMIAAAFGPSLLTKITTGLGGLAGLLFPKLAGKPILAVVGAAGGIAGAVYEDAWIRAALTLDAIKSLFTRVGESSEVQAAAASFGGRLGTAIQGGIIVGLAAGLVLELVKVYTDAKASTKSKLDEVGASVAALVVNGSLTELKQARGDIQTQYDKMYAISRSSIFGNLLVGEDELGKLKRQLAAIDTAINGSATGWRGDIGAARSDITTKAAGIADAFGPIISTVSTVVTDVRQAMSDIVEAVKGARSKLSSAAGDAADAIFDPIIAKANEAATERELADQTAIASGKVYTQAEIDNAKTNAKTDAERVAASKMRTADEIQNAKDRITELNKTRIQQLGILAGYGDQAAIDTLQSWITAEESISNLSVEQQVELKLLKDALAGAREEAAKLNSKLAVLAGLSRQDIVAKFSVSPTGDIVDKTGTYAGGGRPPVGRASWVGEHGPELWVPDTAGTILPADVSRQVVASGAGGNVYHQESFTVQLPTTARPSPFEVANQMRRMARLGLLAAPKAPAGSAG